MMLSERSELSESCGDTMLKGDGGNLPRRWLLVFPTVISLHRQRQWEERRPLLLSAGSSAPSEPSTSQKRNRAPNRGRDGAPQEGQLK